MFIDDIRVCSPQFLGSVRFDTDPDTRICTRTTGLQIWPRIADSAVFFRDFQDANKDTFFYNS
jgi:hypothetical protein